MHVERLGLQRGEERFQEADNGHGLFARMTSYEAGDVRIRLISVLVVGLSALLTGNSGKRERQKLQQRFVSLERSLVAVTDQE